MVTPAHQDDVIQVGLAAVGPVNKMVTLGPVRRAITPWEAASEVTNYERNPESRRNHSSGAPHIYRL